VQGQGDQKIVLVYQRPGGRPSLEHLYFQAMRLEPDAAFCLPMAGRHAMPHRAAIRMRRCSGDRWRRNLGGAVRIRSDLEGAWNRARRR
jgi:hypothetical protein